MGFRQISSTELSTGAGCLSALAEQQQIARCQGRFTEPSQANGIPLFFEKQGAVEHQPKLQRAPEQAAQ
ncbi:hypothetical protein D3C80_2224030 [compost metagenome]